MGISVRNIILFVVGIVIGVVLSIVIYYEDDELGRRQEIYCEMVHHYDASGGEIGWPAYKGSSQCEK